MPHLNELHEKFGPRGLSIISVTSEGAGPTEKWVAENEVKYAYAYDKGGKLMRDMGVTGIPNAILINPAGKIVWQGGPGGLTDDLIEEHLAGSLKTPVWEWPKEASSVRTALVKRQFKKAIDEAAELTGQETGGIQESLIALVEGRAKALSADYESGDFLSAAESAKTIAQECAGLPAGDTAKEISKKISSDSEAKRVMKGQAAVRKLKQEELKRPKEIEEAIAKLEKLSRKFEGTAAATEADALAAQLASRLEH